jgi:molybdate transport system ATP-binding protein
MLGEFLTKEKSMSTIDIQKKLGTCQRIQARFDVAKRSITALYGHSGAGKTSILSMIAGLLFPDSGLIEMNGRVLFDSTQGINLPPEQRRTGYIFQDNRLFPFMSVKANLLFSGYTDASSPFFNEIVDLLDIGGLLIRRPTHLSGGEAQRVAIGRALLSQPDLLLLDEPMSYLDNRCRCRLVSYLREIPQRFSIPLILVTHSMDEIKKLADQVVQVEHGKTLNRKTSNRKTLNRKTLNTGK